MVALDPRATAAYGIAGRFPEGAIIVLPGVVVRVRADGGLDEVGGAMRRWSVSADPCAGRRRAP